MALFWAYISFAADKLVALIVTVMLARLLLPKEFGLIATVLVGISMVDALRELGLKDALIYLDEDSETNDTAFWLNLALGLMLSAAALLAAPAIAGWLDGTLSSVVVVRLMGLSFVVNSLGSTHEALLHKNLRFNLRYYADLIATLVKGVVSLGLVWSGYGIVGLATGFLAASAARTAGRWVLCGWMPTRRFSRRSWYALISYGQSVFAMNAIDIALGGVDQIAIATLLGSEALGFFYIGSRIPEMAIVGISLVAIRIMFPIFSTFKSDSPRLVNATLAATHLMSVYVAPLAIGAACIADVAVPVLFGEVWQPAVPVMSILALSWALDTITWPLGESIKAAGRPGLLASLSALKFIYMPLLTLLGLWVTRSPAGACLGNLVAFMLSGAILLVTASNVIGLGVRVYLSSLWPSMLAAAFMVGVVALARYQIGVAAGPTGLVVLILAGGFAYVLAIFALDQQRLRTLWVEIRSASLPGTAELTGLGDADRHS